MRRKLQPGDVVLVLVRETPAFYAQIRTIETDVKKGWYRVSLHSPLGDLEWILEDVHIFLGQTWTFQGIPYRMERIGRRREGSGTKTKPIFLRRVK
jgi:hypothetical protein